MKPALTRFLVVSGVMVAALGAAFWVITHPRRHDPYEFLRDHPLLDVGVQGPGSFGPKEYRLYSWKEPIASVQQKAAECLPRYGLKPYRAKSPQQATDWTGTLIDGGPCGYSSDRWIVIEKGRYQHMSDFRKDNNDPDWTTVVVSEDLEESWVNFLRYSLFSERY